MEDEYVKNRLDNQIKWYSEKSQFSQKWYKRMRLLEIISASLITFLAGLGSTLPFYSVIIGSLGVVVAVSAGFSSLYKFHENWIEYRATAETLKHEKYLYQTNCEPYNDGEAFCRLVQRVEGLISKEHSKWSRSASKIKTE